MDSLGADNRLGDVRLGSENVRFQIRDFRGTRINGSAEIIKEIPRNKNRGDLLAGMPRGKR